ncbi:MAG TPA: hypothetical protein VM165_23320 [Planctomycetaceae bacterium]|nr:hypothetical protein [Planctomycetaceae bacterium]
MTQRREEHQFGSDSFLDVICNVVGILIILMVLAGLRAGQEPVRLTDMDDDAEIVSASVASGGSSSSAPEPIDLSLGEPTPLNVAPAVVELVAPPSPPRELVTTAEELQREIAAMAGDYESAVARQTISREQQAQLEAKLAAARAAVEQRQQQVDAVRQKRVSTTAEVTKLRQMVTQLSTQLEQAEAVTPKLPQIEHRITPIGQEITGKELHFQVLHNRVALVPLEPLIDRLKDQVERRKDWLAKSRQQMGEVGPIDGFSMSYIVEREAMSVVDELRYGQGMFRIGVSSWQLKPERNLVSEPAAQAIQPGSRFYAALLEAGEGAALTFWVYPDSFAAFGELKKFCHSQNFLVAGRPLPEGQPISGSPSGSRSTGQ